MSLIRAVSVYCSSSSRIDPVYLKAAADTGRAIAENNWKLVYGGNLIGAMAELAKGARSAGGKVIGITPRLLVDKGIADNQCDELIVTDSMRQRKELLEQRGDAFIALPGGLGTFEELFEIVVARQLGYHHKPIILLNINNYYTPLLAAIDHGIESHFIRGKNRELWEVCATVEEGIEAIRRLDQENSRHS